MRLTDADGLKKAIAHHKITDSLSRITFESEYVYEVVKADMYRLVTSALTIEAEPVRHGRWIRMNDGFTKWQCSACGVKYHDTCWKFCPHCGAKMDGESG